MSERSGALQRSTTGKVRVQVYGLVAVTAMGVWLLTASRDICRQPEGKRKVRANWPYASHNGLRGSRRSMDSRSTKTGREPSKRMFNGVASLRIQPSWSSWPHNSSVSSAAANPLRGSPFPMGRKGKDPGMLEHQWLILFRRHHFARDQVAPGRSSGGPDRTAGSAETLLRSEGGRCATHLRRECVASPQDRETSRYCCDVPWVMAGSLQPLSA